MMTRKEEIKQSNKIMDQCFKAAVHSYDVGTANHGYYSDTQF